MGVNSAAIFTNIALCCFHAQQYDMIVACFLKALACATSDEERADIWYNIGEMALVREMTALVVLFLNKENSHEF